MKHIQLYRWRLAFEQLTSLINAFSDSNQKNDNNGMIKFAMIVLFDVLAVVHDLINITVPASSHIRGTKNPEKYDFIFIIS